VGAKELHRPVLRVGVLLPGGPGGRAWDLISAVVPAQVAGVGGIAVCSAPGGSGEIADSVLAACAVADVTEVYRIGGAQAIAALAYGTETVRPVDIIIGSGGPFVRCAQRLVRGWVGTGPEVGPSELVIIANDGASPRAIAAELVANAARGPQGTHALLTESPELLNEVMAALDVVVDEQDPSGDIENALIEGGRAILVRDLDQAIAIANASAPQFLMLSMADPEAALTQVRNAGSVFVGDGTRDGAALFLSATRGLTPTGGNARWDSALVPSDFIKTIGVARTGELDELRPHLEVLTQSGRSRADNGEDGS
jgi:histidinol dehydrogenase